MEDKFYEGRIFLSLNAFKKGQYPSIPKAVAAFDVNSQTLRKQLKVPEPVWDHVRARAQKSMLVVPMVQLLPS